jgi:hypothetical protein
MHSEASTVGRLRDELWRKNLNAIGLASVQERQEDGDHQSLAPRLRDDVRD